MLRTCGQALYVPWDGALQEWDDELAGGAGNKTVTLTLTRGCVMGYSMLTRLEGCELRYTEWG